MFYKQIVIHNRLPFNVKLQSYQTPIALGSLTAEELNAELMKGYESIKRDRKYSPDEVDAIFEKEFGV